MATKYQRAKRFHTLMGAVIAIGFCSFLIIILGAAELIAPR